MSASIPEIIEQPNNRVDLIFTITEGVKTGVKSIEFIGNNTYSSYRLKDIIKTHETNLLSFLASGDVYDPDRVEADRDLIRRFYLKHGFADVQVVAALTEYDPERKGFLVTFKIEEGQQYRVASVNFQSSIPTLDGNSLSSFSHVYIGSLYNAEALEKSVEEMQIEASRRGYAFAVVHPRGDRNFDAHTVSIIFGIDEGPQGVYRAHQYTRQHPHPRLCDPPRIRCLGGRCLQPRAGRSRRAPAQEPRFLQDRQDHHRTGIVDAIG